MLDSKGIRNTIVRLLHEGLNIAVVPQDMDGAMPAYPFITYTATSPYIGLGGRDIERVTLDGAVASLERTNSVELVYSFTVYSNGLDEATDVCMGIIEFFNRTARETLSDSGIVVVSMGDAQNRSLFLGDHYERRWGCDIRFRAVDYTKSATDYIETAEIEQEG